MRIDKFVQYELSSHGPREEPQPRCILLESQLESLKHHFVHWNLSGPTPTVKCQVSDYISVYSYMAHTYV